MMLKDEAKRNKLNNLYVRANQNSDEINFVRIS